MELCLKVGEAAVCLKWAGLSDLVDSIQLILWVIAIWQLYLFRQAARNR